MIENKIEKIISNIPEDNHKLYNFIKYRMGILENPNPDYIKKKAFNELKKTPYLLKQDCYNDIIDFYRKKI
jgi:hypothetical protein